MEPKQESLWWASTYAKEAEGPIVIGGAGKFCVELWVICWEVGTREVGSGKRYGQDIEKRHELMVRGNACVPQQRSESEDEI